MLNKFDFSVCADCLWMVSGRRVASVARGQWPRTCNDACGGASTPQPLSTVPPITTPSPFWGACACCWRQWNMDMNFHFGFGFSCVFCFGFSKTLVFQSGAKTRFYEWKSAMASGAELRLKCLAHVWPALAHITSQELYSNNLHLILLIGWV